MRIDQKQDEKQTGTKANQTNKIKQDLVNAGCRQVSQYIRKKLLGLEGEGAIDR